MSGSEELYGVKVEKVIDNGDNLIGPILISNPGNSTSPQISGIEGIFQSGDEKLNHRILSLISNTKEILCVSSFLIQGSDIISEIQKCHQRGVRVYILTAGEVQLSDPMEQDGSDQVERRKASRELLIDLGDKSLIKTGNNLHSKFIISDPKTNPRAIVLTSNLTVRALNENLELAVELSGTSAMELFRQFIIGFWVVAARTLSKSEENESSLKATKNHPEFAKTNYVPTEIKWTVNDQDLIKSRILEMIDISKESISISAWTIISSHLVAIKLLERAKMGVKVTVFTRPHKDNVEFIKQLISYGGIVYCHDLMHGKSLIVDDKLGLIMTANISKLGLDEGFETAVILKKQQTEVLKKIHNEWKARATYVSSFQTRLKDITKPWIDLNKELKDIDPPKALKERDLGKIRVSNIIDYFNKNLVVPKGSVTHDSVLTKYKAILLPPVLPKNAEEKNVSYNTSLKIYATGNQIFVCIKNKNELDEAKKVSNELKANIVFQAQ